MINLSQADSLKPLRIGHLSDLHLGSTEDLSRLDAQLSQLVAQGVQHLTITGDLLDSWNPVLLAQAFQSLRRSGFGLPQRLTVIHGNHDLASLGGPRKGRPLAAQWLRAFDIPPVAAWRRARFYTALGDLHPAHAQHPPFIKRLEGGIELIALDSVPLPLVPIRVTAHDISATHAIGRIRTRDLGWLDALPLPPRHVSRVLLLHHYPLDTPPLHWYGGLVQVPMAIEHTSRRQLWTAIRAAKIALVLCGHVHRARRERIDGVVVGLQGTSGGEWAGYGSSVHDLPRRSPSELGEEAGAQVDGGPGLAPEAEAFVAYQESRLRP